jgi:hypothetical protein
MSACWKSYRYSADGRRLDPEGGHYMIPADVFDEVVARAQHDRSVLNCFEFRPLERPCRCPTTARR